MTVTRALWLPDVLHAAGLQVDLQPGWDKRGGAFTDLQAVVEHHDASAPGASPGVPAYMAGQIDGGHPGAQLWVSLTGRWTVVASGRVSHAGAVLPGKPSNSYSLGVETDHTTGEQWPAAQLVSLHKGCAAILRHLGRAPAKYLHMHKTICSPPGRKTDPSGLDLAAERVAVSRFWQPVSAPPVKVQPDPPVWNRSRPGIKAYVTAPVFPLPSGWYFGPRSGPVRYVSGYLGGSGKAALASFQQRLQDRGWAIHVDGLYGDDTAEVVRAFQREKHLTVDGLIGPATWSAAWTAPVT